MLRSHEFTVWTFTYTESGLSTLGETLQFIRNERNWMKKSARVSEKLVSLGLHCLVVATRLALLFSQIEIILLEIKI